MKRELFIGLLLPIVISVSCLHEEKRNYSKGSQDVNLTQKRNPKDPKISDAFSLQKAFIEVANKVKPAVVSIVTTEIIKYPIYEFYFGDPFEDFFRDFERFFFGRPWKKREEKRKEEKKRYWRYKKEGGGSGFIIDEKGYILTNEHVTGSAEKIKVIINLDDEEKEYIGKIVGKDPRTDIAIIKISADEKLPCVELGDSDNVKVGEWVIAIGSPFGLQQTVTAGVVSALRQSIYVEGRVYRDFIQTDAAINRGNSGGPLCNLEGKVIGINTAIFAPTGVFAGIGFAIPINRAKKIIDELIEKGKVVRGWLGIYIQSIDDAFMKQFDLPDKKGALVERVIKDSPAEKGGIKRGDVIREVNGKEIKDAVHLQDVIGETSPGTQVKIKVIRDGKMKILKVKLGEMPTDLSKLEKKEKKKYVEWKGLKVQELNDELIEKYEIPSDEKGVVVVEVETGSEGSDIGLVEGDLIKSINRVRVKDLNDFERITEKIDLSEGVVFDIIRRGIPHFISYISPK